MRSFYNFGVLEALPPPARAVLCPPPGDSNPPPVPPACKPWTACPAARLRLFKISFCANPDTVPATNQNNRPRRGGSVRLCAALCAVFRACLVWIFHDHCGGCAVAVWRHGGAGKGQKESRPRRGGSGLIYSFSKALQGQQRGKR